MSRKLSAKYYQENKERLQKKSLWKVENIKIFLKKKKRKSNKMFVKVAKMCKKMKNKSLLCIKQ